MLKEGKLFKKLWVYIVKLNASIGLYLSILWFFYSIYIFVFAEVNWRAELRQDGWYRIYEEDETDFDDRGGHVTTTVMKYLDGPYTKYEINNLYSNEVKENKKFMNSYVTIYNLPYWFYHKNSMIFNIIGILIHIIFLLSIPVLSYSIEMSKKG